MRRRKRRIQGVGEYRDIDLNIMPFIDVFSMLNTFLLMSAVLVSIGILEVQVPFLTNAAPPDDKPERSLVINLGVEKDKIELETRWTAAPIDEKKEEFGIDDAALSSLHTKLVELRTENPKTDKVNVFSEDDVGYVLLTKVLDAVKLRRDGDPVFVAEDGEKEDTTFLFRKVIMASVIL